jgi:hypothetical protein
MFLSLRALGRFGLGISLSGFVTRRNTGLRKITGYEFDGISDLSLSNIRDEKNSLPECPPDISDCLDAIIGFGQIEPEPRIGPDSPHRGDLS